MRFIAIVPLWLGLMSSCLAAPPHIMNFQDESSQYNFNYDGPLSPGFETRSADGMTRGIFRYVDANGQQQTSEYEAGQDLGFNVKATNLPQAPLPVQETPEIQAARQKHLQFLEDADRQDESERSLQRNGQGLPITPEIRNGPEGFKNGEIPGALLKFHQQTGIKEGPQGEINQQPENGPAGNSRFNGPAPNSQIIPDANERSFQGFGNGPSNDFPANFNPQSNGNPALSSFSKSGASSLPLPEGNDNIPEFLRGNPNLASPSKSDANSLPFPQDNGDFNQFPKGNPNFNQFQQGNNAFQKSDYSSLPLPKGDVGSQSFPQGDDNLNQFFKGNGDFSSLPKSEARPQPLPQGDSDSNQLLKGNSFNPNFNPFSQGNAGLPDFQKADASSLLLPKGDDKFSPFQKENAGQPSFPKNDARPQPFTQDNVDFNQLFKENGDFSFPKSDARPQPVSQGNTDSNPFLKGSPNSNPFLQGNDALPNFQKTDASSLPKGGDSFSPFQKENAGQPPFPINDARPQSFTQDNVDFNQFFKENSDFSSSTKNDARPQPFSQGNADSNPFLKGNPNSNPFLQGNSALPNFQKADASSLPKGDDSFSQFQKENSGQPKNDARPQPFPQDNADFNQFFKENGDLSFPKSDARPQPISEGNADSKPFLKGNPNSNPFLQGNNAFQKENAGQPPLPKSEARPQPFSQGDVNFNQFSKENNALPSPPKSVSNSLPAPKGDANLNSFLNFNPLLNGDENTLSLLKSDPNFSSLLKEHNKFLTSLQSANLLQLPKNDYNFAPPLKNDAPNRGPAPMPQLTSAQTPEQRPTAPLPEPVKDTPEVAAAREAHLQAFAEAASKLAEPVKDTPEVLAAREAHLKLAAEPKPPMPVETPNVPVDAPNAPVESSNAPAELPKYTPEVQAAREAHFRAYALAAKLARESDINPKILEELLGRPGEPKLGPQKIKEFESLLLNDKSLEGLKRLMESLAMKFDVPVTKTDEPKETLPVPMKATINLAEKPQLMQPPTAPVNRLSTGTIPASTNLKIPAAGLSSLDEFEQSKIKAATDLSCGTALKVKDLKNSKPIEDQRLVIVKSLEPALFVDLSPDQIQRLKNWAFQYRSL